METSFQAWKYAKGLYLIPLFMVYNEVIILGGPLHLVLWNGIIVIIALVAFAAVLEGYLWAPMDWWQRVLLIPGIISVFWPEVPIEASGVLLICAVLFLNYRRGKSGN
jgi:TRAP-type uncharacterized transport system fused permease subunit